MTQRQTPRQRKAALLDAALVVATSAGYAHMTREAIAAHAAVSPALISHHLGTMPQLRRAVMRAAVTRQMAPIVAQGLAAKDPQAQKAPDHLKQQAASLLTA